jgi:hypothetical protein
MRYVVKIEVQTAPDECLSELDDDVDHLSELHQVLEGLTDEELIDEEDDATMNGDYDLCPDCHAQYLKNPLGRDAVLPLGFSNN